MCANHASHSWVGVGTTNQSGYLKYWSNSWDNRYKGGTTLALGHRNGLAVIPTAGHRNGPLGGQIMNPKR